MVKYNIGTMQGCTMAEMFGAIREAEDRMVVLRAVIMYLRDTFGQDDLDRPKDELVVSDSLFGNGVTVTLGAIDEVGDDLYDMLAREEAWLRELQGCSIAAPPPPPPSTDG